MRWHCHMMEGGPAPTPHPHQPHRAGRAQGLCGPGVSHTCLGDKLLPRSAHHRPTGNISSQAPCSEQGESRRRGTTLLLQKAQALFKSAPPRTCDKPSPHHWYCSQELLPGHATRLCHRRGDNLQLSSLHRNNSEHFLFKHAPNSRGKMQ